MCVLIILYVSSYIVCPYTHTHTHTHKLTRSQALGYRYYYSTKSPVYTYILHYILDILLKSTAYYFITLSYDILLHMCPQNYYYYCKLLYSAIYYYICVLILNMHIYTTTYVSSYSICIHARTHIHTHKHKHKHTHT